MTELKPKKPKPLWLGAMFVAIGMVILLGLGTWQVQRLHWKEGLLDHIARLQGARAVPIESVLGRPAKDLDFVRVSLTCPELTAGKDPLTLYTLIEGETGFRLIKACAVGRSEILVDLGVVGSDYTASAAPLAATVQQPLIGVLRVPPGRNLFTPANDPAKGLYYWLNIPGMATSLGTDGPKALAPVVFMLESPPVAPARPSAIPADIPNRHLEYALTWYGLAAALAGVYIAMLLRRRTP